MHINFDIEREYSKEIFKEITNNNIDGKEPFNFHSQIELYFVNEGQIDACINHQRCLLKKNQMAIALSYDAHLFRSVGDSSSTILVIPPEICKEVASTFQSNQIKTPFICNEKTVLQIKSYLDEIKNNNCNKIKLKGLLYIILGIVFDNIFLEESKRSSIDLDLSTKILSYLNQNFKNELTLSSLSLTFGLSQSYISRYFKSCFGVGLNRYINILRLRNALMLLQDKNNTHTYCAFESGFSSMRTFYRVFKQEFGYTPMDYTSIHNSLF